MIAVIVILIVSAGAHAFVFRESVAGSPAFWWGLCVPYTLLDLLALHQLRRRKRLDALMPRFGDLSIGVSTGALLLFASFLCRSTLSPTGTPRQAWLYRIFLQVGDPEVIQHSAILTLAVLFIACSEELVWRGAVLEILSERLGSRPAWLVTTLAYTAVMLPSLFALRDPIAGLNPLLPIAALGAGLVWSFLAARQRRLPPVMISHMVFSYFTIVQFRWPTL
ncbi:MAG TPA: CPBP family intramembrane glutamic endopeptidase [Polyangiaceae bacterium]|nr:CPBP family intramembrane glutamic endopeptidase [Polyangiaceae bacterium]